MKNLIYNCMNIVFLIMLYRPVVVFSKSDPIPERVISLGPIITKIIYLLEAEKKLIANTTYCTVPPEAQYKEKIGSLIQVNVEKIISLNPEIRIIK